MLFIKEKSHTLTVAELPAHSHGRGTQEIYGYGTVISDSLQKTFKGLSRVESALFDNATGGGWGQAWNFDFYASRNWTGTSQSIGSGTAFSILPPYSVAYCFKRVL